MIYYIIFLHWVADFICQTDKMAKNKSTSWIWLANHVTIYQVTLFIGLLPAFKWFTPLSIFNFVLYNGGAHFFIDAVTSRITSKLWAKGQTHNFFVVIGLDQLLHTCILIWSMRILISKL